MSACCRWFCGFVAVLCLLSCAPAENEAEQASDTARMIDSAQVIDASPDSPAMAPPESTLTPVVRDSAATDATRPATKGTPPIIGRDSVIQPVLVPDSDGRLVPRDTL